VATGEGWNDLMDAVGQPYSDSNKCVDSPTYKDYIEAGEPNGCGNYFVTYIYFFSYITLVSLVFLNLFVAIILDGYFRTKDQEGHELNGIILGVF
jgi:hypothetical protein